MSNRDLSWFRCFLSENLLLTGNTLIGLPKYSVFRCVLKGSRRRAPGNAQTHINRKSAWGNQILCLNCKIMTGIMFLWEEEVGKPGCTKQYEFPLRLRHISAHLSWKPPNNTEITQNTQKPDIWRISPFPCVISQIWEELAIIGARSAKQ